MSLLEVTLNTKFVIDVISVPTTTKMLGVVIFFTIMISLYAICLIFFRKRDKKKNHDSILTHGKLTSLLGYFIRYGISVLHTGSMCGVLLINHAKYWRPKLATSKGGDRSDIANAILPRCN